MPLGDDFKYKDIGAARTMFDNYQMLFDYINNDASLKAHIRFATLGDYFDAVKAEKKGPKFPGRCLCETAWLGVV